MGLARLDSEAQADSNKRAVHHRPAKAIYAV
jgi:hypothetical protein